MRNLYAIVGKAMAEAIAKSLDRRFFAETDAWEMRLARGAWGRALVRILRAKMEST